MLRFLLTTSLVPQVRPHFLQVLSLLLQETRRFLLRKSHFLMKTGRFLQEMPRFHQEKVAILTPKWAIYRAGRMAALKRRFYRSLGRRLCEGERLRPAKSKSDFP